MICGLTKCSASNLSYAGSSSLVETKKTSSQSVTVDQEQLDLSLGANILMPSDNSASKMNKQNMPSLVARENTNKQLSLAMRWAVFFCYIFTSQSFSNPQYKIFFSCCRLKKVRKSPISRIERRPEIALEKKVDNSTLQFEIEFYC